jgi:hypothetical protein
MIFFYGSGEGDAVLGSAGEYTCPSCGEMSAFSAVVHYTYYHLYWLFSFVTGRQYRAVCGNCGATTPIDPATTRERFPKDAIPFIRRRGWMLVLAAVGALVVYFGVAGHFENQARAERERAYLASPRKNDVYLANLAKVDGSGFPTDKGALFGVMKLMETEDEDGDLTFATSTVAYESVKDLRNILGKRPRDIKYDTDGLLYLTPEECRRLHGEGVIIEVRR